MAIFNIFERYCDHCPAWIGHVVGKAGFCMVYDVIDRAVPQCRNYIFQNKASAVKKRDELHMQGHQLLFTNFKEELSL